MALQKETEMSEDDPFLENIPTIGITEASPNHVNADHFFTTALIMHLQNEKKTVTDPNTTSFNDSIYSQNALNTSNHSNNLLLPSRRRTKSRRLSESSSASTIIVSRRIVKRCRFLGLDMCCTPKYGWIIGYGILIWLLLLVGCQQIFKGEILENKNQNGVRTQPYRVFSLSIFAQLITSSILIYGLVNRETKFFIPALILNCYEILAHLVIVFSISLCYYGDFNTTRFLRRFKWFSIYAFDTSELWPTTETTVNFLKFNLTTAEKNKCNDYEAFRQFLVNMVVILLYVGLTYGLNNYRLRLICRKIKKERKRMERIDQEKVKFGKRGDDFKFSDV
jgi:hypothetical protein